jgi:hypothetical protein
MVFKKHGKKGDHGRAGGVAPVFPTAALRRVTVTPPYDAQSEPLQTRKEP